MVLINSPPGEMVSACQVSSNPTLAAGCFGPNGLTAGDSAPSRLSEPSQQ
jgi:hypothetical protein